MAWSLKFKILGFRIDEALGLRVQSLGGLRIQSLRLECRVYQAVVV